MDEKLIIAILAARETGERVLLHGESNFKYAEAVVKSFGRSGYVIEKKIDLQRIGYIPRDEDIRKFHAG